MSVTLRTRIRNRLPKPLLFFYRFVRDYRDIAALVGFLRDRNFDLPFGERMKIVRQIYVISTHVQSPHTQTEVLSYMRAILSLPREKPGCVVEAGCFKGGSTAKFSLAASLAGRQLVVFDSFEGIPENVEDHGTDIFGNAAGFEEGSYRGGLEEVQASVENYGDPSVCRFIRGWFDDSMPGFDEPIAAAYLDVDLVSSTRTCLTYLWPLLQPGGMLFSQDGHLPKVLELFDDDSFWRDVLGIDKPKTFGFGTSKLIHIRK